MRLRGRFVTVFVADADPKVLDLGGLYDLSSILADF